MSEAEILPLEPVDQAGAWVPPALASPELDLIMVRKEVCAAMRFSPATLYREIAAGRFPAPIELSKRRKGWLRSQVAARQRENLPRR
jgi:predicted DNA-binding transcriptional regulator AlpA